MEVRRWRIGGFHHHLSMILACFGECRVVSGDESILILICAMNLLFVDDDVKVGWILLFGAGFNF